jgi:hypothetical protein
MDDRPRPRAAFAGLGCFVEATVAERIALHANAMNFVLEREFQ